MRRWLKAARAARRGKYGECSVARQADRKATQTFGSAKARHSRQVSPCRSSRSEVERLPSTRADQRGFDGQGLSSPGAVDRPAGGREILRKALVREVSVVERFLRESQTVRAARAIRKLWAFRGGPHTWRRLVPRDAACQRARCTASLCINPLPPGKRPSGSRRPRGSCNSPMSQRHHPLRSETRKPPTRHAKCGVGDGFWTGHSPGR